LKLEYSCWLIGHINVINSPGQNAEKHVETDYNYTMEVFHVKPAKESY